MKKKIAAITVVMLLVRKKFKKKPLVTKGYMVEGKWVEEKKWKRKNIA